MPLTPYYADAAYDAAADINMITLDVAMPLLLFASYACRYTLCHACAMLP